MTYRLKNTLFFIKNAVSLKHAVDSFNEYRLYVEEDEIELYNGEIPKNGMYMEAICLKQMHWWINFPNKIKLLLIHNYCEFKKIEYILLKELSTDNIIEIYQNYKKLILGWHKLSNDIN